MSNNINKKVWLIGAGKMAQEYARVLAEMKIRPVVIGRGEESAQAFCQNTGLEVVSGGLHAFLETQPEKPDAAIIAVNVVDLARTAAVLLGYCQPRVLLEKPGAITSSDIDLLASCAGTENVFIAYNRRFFQSTQTARNMLNEDGGAVSCTFEFTEWAHRIEPLLERKHAEEMKHWLIANSSHVIDMAFYLAGRPETLNATVSGSLPWHPSGSAFCGSGSTDRGAIFSYQANWKAPGRWWVEVMSEKRRYRMCPLETVQIQNKGEVEWHDVELDLSREKGLKPGLYDMVITFLADEPSRDLCRFSDLIHHFPMLQKIAGY